MKRKSIVVFIFIAILCAPQFAAAQSFSVTAGDVYREEGIASWYGPEFDGRPTASGEIFNSTLFTAAHPTLPFGTFLIVTNKNNNRQVTVKVNDRGPFVASRIIDLSKAAAEHIDMVHSGTVPVIISTLSTTYLQPPPLEILAVSPPAAPIHVPDSQPPTMVLPPEPSAPPRQASPSHFSYPPITLNVFPPAQPQPQAQPQVQPQPLPPPPPPQMLPPPPPPLTPQPQPIAQPPAPPALPPPYTEYLPPPPYVEMPQQQPAPPPQYLPPPPYVEMPQQQPAPPPQYLPPPPYVELPQPQTPPPYSPPAHAEAPMPPALPPSAPPQMPAPADFLPPSPPSASASGIRLIPDINPVPGTVYRLQVGSYRAPRNAVDAFDKLKRAGLNPAYEQHGDFYRVVLAGIQGTEIPSVKDKLERAGFREAVIRVDH
ncbi:MAG: septal ring lytic transglycosylase RlpA family protein [Treponema sp.]|jgi:rare lipoprotein A (peptidoglycan hydrolase)|nr:septal ring lytic transglycosylase RlpA family protein [Treponema sp.]